MVINVYDKNLERLGAIDKISSLTWRRRYWQCGDFVLLLPMDEHHAQLIKQGRLIMPHGYDEAAEIKYIDIRKNDDGVELIEVQGKFLPRWIGKRIVLSRIIATDAPENLIVRIAEENAINPADDKRKISQLTAAEAQSSGQQVEYTSNEYANALGEIEQIAKTAEIGYKVVTDARAKTNTLHVYVGRDLTAGNAEGNEPCIFAYEYDNVLEQSYVTDNEDKRNMAYAGGEEIEGEDRLIVEVGSEFEGLDRDEIFADARDIRQTYRNAADEEVSMTDEEYAEMVRQRGWSDLAQYTDVLEFDGRINPSANLKYREDFDLGDIVTCREKRWGIQLDVRITEVVESYQPGENELAVVFGRPAPTLKDKLKRIKGR